MLTEQVYRHVTFYLAISHQFTAGFNGKPTNCLLILFGTLKSHGYPESLVGVLRLIEQVNKINSFYQRRYFILDPWFCLGHFEFHLGSLKFHHAWKEAWVTIAPLRPGASRRGLAEGVEGPGPVNILCNRNYHCHVSLQCIFMAIHLH